MQTLPSLMDMQSFPGKLTAVCVKQRASQCIVYALSPTLPTLFSMHTSYYTVANWFPTPFHKHWILSNFGQSKLERQGFQGNKGRCYTSQNSFFLMQIIPTAIFIPYWSGVQVEIEENNTWVSISLMRILHCASS